MQSIYLTIKTPTSVLDNKCPYQLLYKHLCALTQLKVFGSLCVSSTLVNRRTKFDLRAIKYIFLGYKSGTKSYVIYQSSFMNVTTTLKPSNISRQPNMNIGG